VLVAEPGCPTVTISIPFARTFAVPPRTMEQLRRVTAHLTAALRLRTRLASAGEHGAAAEAVLDPRGKVLDASGPAASAPARASLTEAVRSVERARGRLRRRHPEEALAIWRALFEGRWSIVERTEADGKRVLLARRNAPGFTDPKALAPGERDVLVYAARGLSNKYIGYLLGVATSTVSTRLTSALRKLSLGSRREAIALLGDLPPVAAAGPASPDRHAAGRS
jgi:DNA-binding CsgD family transcriptional regulator